MKKRNGPFYALPALLISCGHHNGDTRITFKEKNQLFKMNAYYSKGRTNAVEHFMNEKIGRQNNMSFLNTRMDTNITLKNGTTFHVEKLPGYLHIELDKTKNSNASYSHMKHICQELKEVILK